ncbi:MAG: vancomycin high temperature exclusion protein [Polyangia bacterium]
MRGFSPVRWLSRVAGASFFGAVALAGPTAWIGHRVRNQTYTAIAELPAQPVAIVLGAAVHRDEPLGSLTDRLRAALTLYQSGRVETVLISGQNTTAQPEVAVMRRWLLLRGVPESHLLVDEHGTRTWNTMRNARALFHVDHAIVCTQALYLPRALYIARTMGIDAVGAGLDTPITLTPRNVGREAAKTTVAFIEASVWGPETGSLPTRPLASR